MQYNFESYAALIGSTGPIPVKVVYEHAYDEIMDVRIVDVYDSDGSSVRAQLSEHTMARFYDIIERLHCYDS